MRAGIHPPLLKRAVYPYSVIPGGVLSNAELRRVVVRDRVAADHYQDFSVERARLEIVAKPRLVFVSYRVADRVYWTRKRILLKAGETILSDGIHQARTRCGNRIADTPQGNSRTPEPDEKTLDTAVSAGNDADSHPEWSRPSETPAPPVRVAAVSPDKYLATFGPALVSGENAGVGSGARGGFGGGGQSSGAASPGGSTGSTGTPSQSAPGNSQPVSSPVQTIGIDQTRVPVPGLFVAPTSTAGTPVGTTGAVQPALPPPQNTQATWYVPALPPAGSNMDTFLVGPAPSFRVPPALPPNPVPPALLPLENTSHLGIGDFAPSVSIAPRVDTGRADADRHDASHVHVPEPSTWFEGLLGTAILVTFLTLRRRGRHAA